MVLVKILIITEGDRTVGLGHITRCLAIIEAFRMKDLHPIMVIRGDENSAGLIKNDKIAFFDWIKNKDRIYRLAENNDIVIVDSYLAGVDFYHKLSRLVKLVVYIDDNDRISYPKGIIINGNFNIKNLKFSRKNDCLYLLGPNYIPLRKEFWSVTKKKINKKVKTCMVTFGGGDKTNMTPMVLDLLKKNYPTLDKKVVIGPGFNTISEITKYQDDKTVLIFHPNAKKVKEIMLEADIAISASGQTVYELIRIGVPTIAIGIASNQLNNINFLSKNNLIEYAGYWNDAHLPKKMTEILSRFMNQNERRKKNSLTKYLIDGLGPQRIVRSILKHYSHQCVITRKAV